MMHQELKHFIKSTYKRQKDACRDLRISESMLSLVLKGERKLPRHAQLRLIAKGLDEQVFYHYVDANVPISTVEPQNFQFIIGALQSIITKQDTMLRAYEMLNANLQKDVDDRNKTITHLKKKVHNLVNSQKFTD